MRRHFIALLTSFTIGTSALASTNYFSGDPQWIGIIERPELVRDWTVQAFGQPCGLQQRGWSTFLVVGTQSWYTHFSFYTSAGAIAFVGLAICGAVSCLASGARKNGE